MRVCDRRLRPVTVYLTRKGAEADYRISVSRPKTHDVVIVTLSIENLVMGHWRTQGPLATVAAYLAALPYGPGRGIPAACPAGLVEERKVW